MLLVTTNDAKDYGVRVSLTTWNDRMRLDVREMWLTATGEWAHTKRGVKFFTPEQAREIASALLEAADKWGDSLAVEEGCIQINEEVG